MSWIRYLFRTNARKNKLDREAVRELAFHIEKLTKKNITADMSPVAAFMRSMPLGAFLFLAPARKP